MTDILTKLAALTANEPQGTTPRPWSAGAQNPMTGEVNVHHEYRDPSFTTTGGRGIRVVATLGNRFRRELDDEARANAELIVQTINRETALIALVQEAAGEIERLKTTLAGILPMHGSLPKEARVTWLDEVKQARILVKTQEPTS